MRCKSHWVVVVALVETIGFLSAPASPASVVLRGAGATFPAPLYQKWADVYEQDHQGVSVNYRPVGSGEGIDQFTAGAIDFGASDTQLTVAELGKVEGGA